MKIGTKTQKTLRGPDRVMTNPRSIKETRVARREKERPALAESTIVREAREQRSVPRAS